MRAENASHVWIERKPPKQETKITLFGQIQRGAHEGASSTRAFLMRVRMHWGKGGWVSSFFFTTPPTMRAVWRDPLWKNWNLSPSSWDKRHCFPQLRTLSQGKDLVSKTSHSKPCRNCIGSFVAKMRRRYLILLLQKLVSLFVSYQRCFDGKKYENWGKCEDTQAKVPWLFVFLVLEEASCTLKRSHFSFCRLLTESAFSPTPVKMSGKSLVLWWFLFST